VRSRCRRGVIKIDASLRARFDPAGISIDQSGTADVEALGRLNDVGRRNTMDENNAPFSSIDAYIASFPKDIQDILNTLRATIRGAAPDAEEKINYQMPTFALKGNLVHFAAHKNHIGFYPTPSGIAAFQDELSQYKRAKGSVQFPFDQPLPLDVIHRIVQFRVAENVAASAAKSRKRNV
jgi:uncharacterized protein YdhG (YjbR/CyaY superfamily)